jgi:hypothetical protein
VCYALAPCPHTLSPHFVSALCRLRFIPALCPSALSSHRTRRFGATRMVRWSRAGSGALSRPRPRPRPRPRAPVLPILPVLPGLPAASAPYQLPRRMAGGDVDAAPRWSPHAAGTPRIPAGRLVLMPNGLLGHPAQRTTCASGFECADPDALSFPPLAAAYADSAGTVGTDVQSSQLVPAAKTPVLLARVPPSGGSGSGASAPFP